MTLGRRKGVENPRLRVSSFRSICLYRKFDFAGLLNRVNSGIYLANSDAVELLVRQDLGTTRFVKSSGN